RTVTGSQLLITSNNKNILLDCGLFQGRRQEAYEKNTSFCFDPKTIDVLLLSHSHMDHSGNIPSLVKRGFNGSIFATPATVDLCKIMLKDSAYLQQRDVEWVNKLRAQKNERPIDPLYTIEDVEASLNKFVDIAYDKSFSIAENITACFIDSGHVLGSASIVLEIEENNTVHRIGYTGDIGRPNMPIIRDPNQIRDVDYLIMESTYGNKLHAPFTDIEETVAELVVKTSKTGGKILIPAFAVGRTQLIVYILHKLFNQNRIPELPIYVDSPLALQATEVYRHHLQLLDRQTKRIFLDHNEDPFGFRRLKYIETVEESKRLNSLAYPHIIISASGMAEGGRILHHLANNISNRKTVVLFVGYAAENTLARKIMDGEKKIKIFGEPHMVKCKIMCLDAFSAHADRRELLNYVALNSPEHLKKIFLIHGELDHCEALRNGLASNGYRAVVIPREGEVAEIK
ncbi:MAG: MBL fold metallo-hydrolase, partial [Chitinivibrionales bacterium]|nr:MBL fold metallo-hydrolase [Chitinivibrionales bacterium]